jgi:lipopolysaccharide transport system permease protein
VSAQVGTIRIEPRKGWVDLGLASLWEFRGLLFWLAWRDVKSRYSQTLMGPVWAVLQPLATVLVLSFFLGFLARVPSDGPPYTLFVLSGVLGWSLFAVSLSAASNSVIANGALVSKVYFPRMVVALSAVVGPLLDFAVGALILVTMALFSGYEPTWRWLLLPTFPVIALVAALGLGLWFGALNVQYRDVTFVVSFLIQLGFFCSPVIYPVTLIPDWLLPFYGLNPMVGVLEAIRWSLFADRAFPALFLGESVVLAPVFLLSGMTYFRQLERKFADVI